MTQQLRRKAIKIGPCFALAIAALGLTGCSQGKKDDSAKTAAGTELLPRSTTDDMLPYDTVTSQPEQLDPGAALSRSHTAPSSQSAQEEADMPEEQDVPGAGAPTAPDAPDPSADGN